MEADKSKGPFVDISNELMRVESFTKMSVVNARHCLNFIKKTLEPTKKNHYNIILHKPLKQKKVNIDYVYL